MFVQVPRRDLNRRERPENADNWHRTLGPLELSRVLELQKKDSRIVAILTLTVLNVCSDGLPVKVHHSYIV